MTRPPSPLARHLEPALDGARLDRQVAAIAARAGLGARPRLGRRWRALALTTVGVLALAALGARSRLVAPFPAAPAAPALTGTTFEAPAGGETITLADGSRAVLDARSRLTLLEVQTAEVRVALERGGVELDVVHADGKQFIVEARGYEIRVLGTRFRVRLGETADAAALQVQVARGRVRVTRAGPDAAGQEPYVRVLDAGETWSTAAPTPDDKPAAVEPVPQVGRGESPRAMLARAEAARAANDPRAAARLFDALRARHRGDPRAGLAAFELGRLRLDRLNDPRGAAEALGDALLLAPDAAFREDAQARLVEAYAASREPARCLDARASYLARYPRGVHKDAVAAACPR